MDEQDDQRDKILGQLEGLNEKLARQISFKHIFYTGIIYGIGFVLGTTILATTALGIFWPFISKITWVGDNFDRGTIILKPTQTQ